uniref:Uncharacterized protein n=1 Tax=Triticum urartu TaxID=4572 RepID=A0A8R7PZ01_TRIUA
MRPVLNTCAPSCALTYSSGNVGPNCCLALAASGGDGRRRSCAWMTLSRRYHSLGDRYALERVCTRLPPESDCHASWNASSTCVPTHTASITSHAGAPSSACPSRVYHCGASALSGGDRLGTSCRSKETKPRCASGGAASPSFSGFLASSCTVTSSEEAVRLALWNAKTWSHSPACVAARVRTAWAPMQSCAYSGCGCLSPPS